MSRYCHRHHRYHGFRSEDEYLGAAQRYRDMQDEHDYDMRAGEFQFSRGRVDEYHGVSHDGTSQGIFDSGHPHSHTVRKDGREVEFHRDRYGNKVIDTNRDRYENER